MTLRTDEILNLNDEAQWEGVVETKDNATGASVSDFTGIPSWVKTIRVGLSSRSTNGTSPLVVQLGDSLGIKTTGYVGGLNRITSTVATTSVITSGIQVSAHVAATDTISGLLTLARISSDPIWVWHGTFYQDASTDAIVHTGGVLVMTQSLTQIRLTAQNGTDTFDGGSNSISYD